MEGEEAGEGRRLRKVEEVEVEEGEELRRLEEVEVEEEVPLHKEGEVEGEGEELQVGIRIWRRIGTSRGSRGRQLVR